MMIMMMASMISATRRSPTLTYCMDTSSYGRFVGASILWPHWPVNRHFQPVRRTARNQWASVLDPNDAADGGYHRQPGDALDSALHGRFMGAVSHEHDLGVDVIRVRRVRDWHLFLLND